MSLKFGRIQPWTAELAALDQFKKSFIRGYSKYFDGQLSGERSLDFGLLVYFGAKLITITDTKCVWVSGVNLALTYILDWLVMMIRHLYRFLFDNFDLIGEVKHKLDFYLSLARFIQIQRLNCNGIIWHLIPSVSGASICNESCSLLLRSNALDLRWLANHVT